MSEFPAWVKELRDASTFIDIPNPSGLPGQGLVNSLTEMLGWLRGRRAFLHFRINDGEFICMFRQRDATSRNNCGHAYFTDLGDELKNIFVEMKELLSTKMLPPVRVGSYWYAQGPGISYCDEPARAFVDWMIENELLDIVPWVGSDDLVQGLTTPLPMLIFDEIRKQCHERSVFLVGNPRIEPGRHCLGAKFIEIPRIDCWSYTEKLMSICKPKAEAGGTFVWCCGMSKPWIWKLWKEYPQSTHLDAGHLFDGVFGEFSRAWLRRQEGPLWQAYANVFSPYVRSFIV